jgi:hypothetical protein
MPLAQYPENNYGDSDSVLKLPHRLTDNLREPNLSHVERVHVIILAIVLFLSLPELFHCENFGVDVFHQIMRKPYHLLSFVPPSYREIPDSLRRFEMNFTKYAD